MMKRKQRKGDISASVNELRKVADDLEKEGKAANPVNLYTNDTKWLIRIETHGDHYDDTWGFPKDKKRVKR